MNDSSSKRLDKVHPELANRVRTLINNLAERGMQVEVVQGFRTFAEQQALFEQGRSRPGPVVTRARAGQSNHNYGLAVDLCPFTDGQPNWNAPLSSWTSIGTEAEKLGLEWGGDWKKFVDKPHVQLPGLSIAQCFSLFNRGKLPAVWAEASRLLGAPTSTVAPAATTATTPVAATSSSHRTVRINDRGDDVRILQQQLIARNLLPAGSADGIFGTDTLKAVKNFQKSNNLTVDGIVGSASWEMLLVATPAAPKTMAKGMPGKSAKKAAGKKSAKKAASKSTKGAAKKSGKKGTAKKRR
jgi:peptidoglycan L-alanyl-D-glutamate endopeptidase CwlK